jgi:glycolate oxidase iron-sulfur subunit
MASVGQPVCGWGAKPSEIRSARIVSANIGCITHLQSGTETPVKHWVELLDEAPAG